MFQKKYYLYFSPADYKVLVNSLVQLKKLIQQGRFTDYVDDLIMNTLGTLVGFLMAKLICRHRTALYRGRKDWLELMMVNAIVLLTIVFVRYPLMEVVLGLLKI